MAHRRRRVRSADPLSPLRHHENSLLLQPRRQSADSLLTQLPGTENSLERSRQRTPPSDHLAESLRYSAQ